ncbi:hypothetical protein Tco_0566268 [Tanacetum coccineum]
MGTIDSMKSVLTQSALDALCERFHIPDVVHLELPGRNDRIRNSPAGFTLIQKIKVGCPLVNMLKMLRFATPDP